MDRHIVFPDDGIKNWIARRTSAGIEGSKEALERLTRSTVSIHFTVAY